MLQLEKIAIEFADNFGSAYIVHEVRNSKGSWMSVEQAHSSREARIGFREMGLALSALAAAVVVSILICQFLIVIATAGAQKRPSAIDKTDICEPSVAVVKPARLSR